MKKNWQLMMVLVVSAVALVFAFILKPAIDCSGTDYSHGVNYCFDYVRRHGQDHSFR